jgi:hypothetical protein
MHPAFIEALARQRVAEIRTATGRIAPGKSGEVKPGPFSPKNKEPGWLLAAGWLRTPARLRRAVRS